MTTQLEKELEYLICKTGKDTTLILAEAVKEGVHVLYKKNVIETYMMNKIDRKDAANLLGETFVDELDNAWRAVESDIRWGMKDE